jgi:hypothetical protein
MSAFGMGLGTIKHAARRKLHDLLTAPPVEAALARLTRDRLATGLVARLAPANQQYQHPAYRQVIRHGITYLLDISDHHDWMVYWGLTADRPGELYLNLQPGSVVFDVGTNIGEVCMTAAALVGPSGMVYAFEPDPQVFRRLTGNLALNRFGNVFAANLGLGARASSGESRHLDTLDDFVSQRGLTRLDVLRVDTGGAAFSVLEGALASVGRFRPRLFVEVCDTRLRGQGSSAVALIDLLYAAGYRLHRTGTGEPIDRRSDLTGPITVIGRPNRA